MITWKARVPTSTVKAAAKIDSHCSCQDQHDNLFRRPPPQHKVWRLDDCDQQLSSPLYDGRIPPEVRDKIFQYAMAEYAVGKYPTNTDYTRPNYLGKKKVSINLLLSCKRAYLETFHLPPTTKEHVFWHFAGPPDQPHSGNERRYFLRFHPAQLILVKEVHLFTQQYWLEESFQYVSLLAVLQGIEKMKMTLRRGDWWFNEHNAPLAITPYRGARSDVNIMKQDWKREEKGEKVAWDERSWGSSFKHLQRLKELEMEFETYEFKKDELDEIVRHAVLWKFPMRDGMVLSADGLEVKTSRWRGPDNVWTECPECEGEDEDSCKYCKEMNALKMEGKGPMLIVSSLRWKLGR